MGVTASQMASQIKQPGLKAKIVFDVWFDELNYLATWWRSSDICFHYHHDNANLDSDSAQFAKDLDLVN